MLRKKITSKKISDAFFRIYSKHPRYFLTLSLILWGSFLALVLASTTFLMQSDQDLRRSADTTQNITLAFTNTAPQVGSILSSRYAITSAKPVMAVKLDVTVKGSPEMLNEFQASFLESNRMMVATEQISSIDGGKKIVVEAISVNGISFNSTPILEIKTKPTAPGNLTFTVEPSSRANFLDNSTSSLVLPPPSQVTIAAPTPTPTPPAPTPLPPAPTPTPPETKDDLYLMNYSYKFYEGDKEIAGDKLQDGTRYTVKIKVTAQNDFKRQENNNTNIILRLTAGNSGLRNYNITYGDLLRSASGITMDLETPFVASNDIRIITHINATNSVPERNTDNNKIETSVITQRSSSGTGGVRSFTSYCNSYCANKSECGFGLSCWNNMCRHPDNVESASCHGPGSSYMGCNISCQSSADCAAGLVCSGNRCRNPLNTSSQTCQVSGGGSVVQAPVQPAPPKPTKAPVATNKPAATTKPTPTPAMTPTPIPTPIIIATPPIIATPIPETVGEEATGFFGSILGIFQDIFKSNSLASWLMIGGAILLVIIIALALMFGKSDKNPTHSKPSSKDQSNSNFKPIYNKADPGIPASLRSTPLSPLNPLPKPQAPITPAPANMGSPTAQKPAMMPPVIQGATQAPVSTTNNKSSMMKKLEEKGVVS